MLQEVINSVNDSLFASLKLFEKVMRLCSSYVCKNLALQSIVLQTCNYCKSYQISLIHTTGYTQLKATMIHKEEFEIFIFSNLSWPESC